MLVGSCPSMNVIKTRGKCVRDNNLGAWNDTWLPISQFVINTDNTVTFSDPPMKAKSEEIYVCAIRMSFMQVTGQSSTLDSGSFTQFTDYEINQSDIK